MRIRNYLIFLVVLAMLALCACSGNVAPDDTSSAAPAESEKPGETSKPADDGESNLPQQPDVNESYIPVHADEIAEPEHVAYPDWSKIAQPELKELYDEAKKSGELAENGAVIGKKEVDYSADICDEYYDTNGRKVIELIRSGDAALYRKYTYQYYSTGEIFLRTTYDMTMEGRPESFTAYRKNGDRMADGDYRNGHLTYVSIFDEGGQMILSLDYYESAKMRMKTTYYNGMTATRTDFREDNDEIAAYYEYDDAGQTVYRWDKYVYEDNFYISYYIVEEKEGVLTEEDYSAEGKKIQTVKKQRISDELYQTLSYEGYWYAYDGNYDVYWKAAFDGEKFNIEEYRNDILVSRYVYSNTANGDIGKKISGEDIG